MTSLTYMMATSAIACCMLVLMVGFSSMHGSLYTLQTAIDEHETAIRMAIGRHSDLEKEVHRLQRTIEESITAAAARQAEVGRRLYWHNESAAQAVAALRSSSAQLSDLLERIRALGQQQDSAARALDEVKATRQAMQVNMSEAESQLDDIRSGSSLSRVWHDQAQTWRDQEQRFEGQTGEALTELRNQIALLASDLSNFSGRNLGPTFAAATDVSLTRLHSAFAGKTSAGTFENVTAPTDAPLTTLHGATTGKTNAGTLENATVPPGAVPTTPRGDATIPHSTEVLQLVRLASSTGAPRDDPDLHDSGPQPARSAQQSSLLLRHGAATGSFISWYRECGCTGMEIEAVTILKGLVRLVGVTQVRTNRCTDTCDWLPATRQVLDRIEILEEGRQLESKMLWADPLSGGLDGTFAFVVHAAFLGVCGVPDFGEPNFGEEGHDVREGRRGLLRVSRSMLETDRLHTMAVDNCNNRFDAVWIPSDFNLKTFSESGVERRLLKVLPEAIDPELFNCSSGSPPARPPVTHFYEERLDQFLADGMSHDTFTFLSVFKWEERKNWRALLNTFLRAFPRRLTEVAQEGSEKINVTVRLLIKTQHLSWGSDPDDDIADLTSRLDTEGIDAAGRILILKRGLPAALIPGLYRAVDAFVLPSHGEGWGLPLMEAMASGLPTIATGWGGNTEFMHPGNSLLLAYGLVDAADYGHRWAEPEQPALRAAMWEVLRRSATSRSIAERACREIPGELYTPDAIARRIAGYLAQDTGK